MDWRKKKTMCDVRDRLPATFGSQTGKPDVELISLVCSGSRGGKQCGSLVRTGGLRGRHHA